MAKLLAKLPHDNTKLMLPCINNAKMATKAFRSKAEPILDGFIMKLLALWSDLR